MNLNIAEPIAPQMIQILRQAIMDMEFQPGQGLSENDIARRYGVSRQPVREAFIKLREAGLLQILPSRGTYVVKISVREVLNARFVREAVECSIVRSAAELIDAKGIDRLQGILEEQRSAAAGTDYRGFQALDEAFHREIATIVDCDYAVRVMESARFQTDRVRALSLPSATPLRVLITQHQGVVDAFRQRDAAKAEAMMRIHLREILSAIPRLAEQHPELFDQSDVPVHARVMLAGLD